MSSETFALEVFNLKTYGVILVLVIHPVMF